MNYRHDFHAGNFADVFKHVVLLDLVGHLKRKPAPFFYLDTHAGAGVYDLSHSAAQRSGEYLGGIGRLLSAPAGTLPPAVAQYVDLVRASAGPHSPITAYPGSPSIVAALRRPGDRMVLVEKQPRDAAALRQAFAKQRRVAIVEGDGYDALRAYLPPAERRGLVLIDPPYESEREFERVVESLVAAHARWPGGIYAIWYPLTSRARAEAFTRALQATTVRRVLDARLSVAPDDAGLGMPGCGIVVVNPPWQLDERLGQLLPELHRWLSADGAGSTSVRWLVTE